MSLEKIDPFDDARITHRFADLNGQKYHYLLADPKGQAKGTVFLIHGWPDCSMGWRNQIPLFLDMGYRCVAPDMMGYAQTAAPEVPPNPLSLYSHKRAADDIKELATQLGCSQIILGGHDWGGVIVFRTVLWYPDLISHLFSICTPYTPPTKGPFVPSEVIVEKYLPQFKYQLQLASGYVETVVNTPETVQQFLKAMYGSVGPNGERGFDVYKGVIAENLPKMGECPLLSPKELEYYTQEYLRHGVHSTLNWYRTRQVNYEEEMSLDKTTVSVPVLYIAASKDAALPPAMSAGMEKFIPNLTRMEVEASHWAPVETPREVNVILKAWLKAALRSEPKSSL